MISKADEYEDFLQSTTKRRAPRDATNRLLERLFSPQPLENNQASRGYDPSQSERSQSSMLLGPNDFSHLTIHIPTI